MMTSKFSQKIMVLLGSTLLTGWFGWAAPMVPVLACEAHEGQYRQIVGEVDVLVDVHTMTEHHQEMAKHSEVMGFSGSHVLVVQLLDRVTGQAVTKADVKADVTGPDQKAVIKGAALV